MYGLYILCNHSEILDHNHIDRRRGVWSFSTVFSTGISLNARGLNSSIFLITVSVCVTPEVSLLFLLVSRENFQKKQISI